MRLFLVISLVFFLLNDNYSQKKTSIVDGVKKYVEIKKQYISKGEFEKTTAYQQRLAKFESDKLKNIYKLLKDSYSLMGMHLKYDSYNPDTETAFLSINIGNLPINPGYQLKNQLEINLSPNDAKAFKENLFLNGIITGNIWLEENFLRPDWEMPLIYPINANIELNKKKYSIKNIPAGKIHIYNPPYSVYVYGNPVFSYNNNILYSSKQDTLFICDLKNSFSVTKKIIQSLKDFKSTKIGDFALSYSNNSIKIYDIISWKVLSDIRIEPTIKKGDRTETVIDIKIAPDGKHFAVAYETFIRLYDIYTLDIIKEFNFPEFTYRKVLEKSKVSRDYSIIYFSFSQGMDFLAIGSTLNSKIISTSSGETIYEFDVNHRIQIYFSMDGSMFYTQNPNFLFTFSTKIKDNLPVGVLGSNYSISLSPDNKFIATISSETLQKSWYFKLWDISSKKLLRSFNCLDRNIVFSNDGKYLVVSNMLFHLDGISGINYDKIKTISFNKDNVPPNLQLSEKLPPLNQTESNVFSVVDELPSPVNGYSELNSIIKGNKTFSGLEGQRVILSLIIDKNGDVKKVEVLKGLNKECNDILIDAIKSIKYVPAKVKGTSVDCKISLPILIK